MCAWGYCEQCLMEDLIRSKANTYSNVSFIVIGFIIIMLGWEDYYLFNKAKDAVQPNYVPPHVAEHMDYDLMNPPNLVMGGAGLLNVAFSLLAMASVFYAGFGAYVQQEPMTRLCQPQVLTPSFRLARRAVYHAGMTQLTRKLDICSVYVPPSLPVRGALKIAG